MELSKNSVIRSGMSSSRVKLLLSFMRRLLVTILCLSFLIFVIPSPSADAVVVADDLALILLATLGAFGITFTATGGIEEVGPWIVDQFEDMLTGLDQSIDTVASSFRVGVSKAGQFIANLPVLEYSRLLGIHIQDQFDLQDNSSVSISDPVQNLPYLSSSIGNIYLGDTSGYNHGATVLELNSVYTLSNGIYFVLAKEGAALKFYLNGQLVISEGGNGSVQCYWLAYNSLNGYCLYYSYTRSPSTITPDSYRAGGQSLASASDMFGSAFSASPPVAQPDIVANTGVIDIPQVGDYDDDDGILIDGLGSWGDTLQDIWNKLRGLTLPDNTWPTVTWDAEASQELVDSLVSAGELTTENSPGFFNGLPLVSGIPDFNFGGIWHYVTDWVNSMSSGLALIGGIMFSLPFAAAFYALVVILLTLGLWRLLRSA